MSESNRNEMIILSDSDEKSDLETDKNKSSAGRFVDGIWLFGCIDEETKQLRLEIIPDNKRSEENMRELIEKHIEPGTTIISDKASSYQNIGKWGFIHKCVNHSEELVNGEGDHTNLIESTWRAVRLALGLGRIKGTIDYHLWEVL